VSGRPIPIGPIGRRVGANVATARHARGLTFAALAARMATRGRPIPPDGLSHIEAGKRRVDMDDLVALALSLGVSVEALVETPTITEREAM
jgi:transcriptional regulator with XRE-family HTH domain